MGPPLTRLRRCAAAATARTRAPSAPSRLLPSDHVGSIHAHRHLRARSGARLRLRRDGPRPGRRRGRHRRRRRLLLERARLLERGVPQREMTCMCARVATCAAIVRLDAAAAAYTPLVLLARVAHNSLRPVCRTGAGHRAAAAPPQRAVLSRPWRPPSGRSGPQRPPRARAGDRRGPCHRQSGVRDLRGARTVRLAAGAAAARSCRRTTCAHRAGVIPHVELT